MNRWWIYQRERFPLVTWVAFIVAVCLGVMAFTTQARGAGAPSWQSVAVAAICTILVFLQLRVADEFKDFEDDAAARPYRPVPRGLVRLSELRVVALVALVVQLALVAALDREVLLPLAAVLAYLGLMTREFFVPRWLRAHPVAYLLSHQLILPLIYFFISTCDWLAAGDARPPGLEWILVMSYASGMVVEIGRKTRAPDDEEKGVETYSALWGRRGAVMAWLLVVMVSGASAVRAAMEIGFGSVVSAVAVILFCALAAIGLRYLSRPAPGAGKKIDAASGVWTIAIHGALGVSLLR